MKVRIYVRLILALVAIVIFLRLCCHAETSGYPTNYPWLVGVVVENGREYKRITFGGDTIYRERKKGDGVLQEMWMTDVAAALNYAHHNYSYGDQIMTYYPQGNEPAMEPLHVIPCGGATPCYHIP